MAKRGHGAPTVVVPPTVTRAGVSAEHRCAPWVSVHDCTLHVGDQWREPRSPRPFSEEIMER